MDFFKEKTILITGGTGALGRGLVKRILPQKPQKIIIFSRSEKLQDDLKKDYPQCVYVLGDITDYFAVRETVRGVDIVIHAAAFKYLDLAELQPTQAVLSNVVGSINILRAVKDEKKVSHCIGISTDKVSYARNVYGCTKQIMEKLFLEAERTKGSLKTKFFLVRYGNVLGTTGSVLTIWTNQIAKKKPLTITDNRMNRFFFSLDEAIDLIFYALKNSKGGDIFIKKMKAVNIGDLAEVFGSGREIREVGLRPGEKLDECLIADYEIADTKEQGNLFILIPYSRINKKIFNYTTDMAPKMSKAEIKNLLKKLK